MKDDKEIHICEQCGNEHNGSYGSGRFCSLSCKQKFIANKSGKVHKCKYCGREFETAQKLGAHVRCCSKNPNWKKAVQKRSQTVKENTDLRNPIIHVKLSCVECGGDYELDVRKDQFKNGNYKHFCSSECAHIYAGKQANPENIKLGMKKSFSKKRIIKCVRCGKDVNVSGSVSNILCEECRAKKTINPSGKCMICGKDVSSDRKTCCKEHEKLLRVQTFKQTCSEKHSVGGLRNKGGRGKRGKYKGIHCDSSWELAWVLYMLDKGISFKRNSKSWFHYEYEGKSYKYYPDFILSDGTYVEIKGWKSPRWQAKVDYFPTDQKLKIYYYDDLKHIFEYVISVYGSDYIKMYD